MLQKFKITSYAFIVVFMTVQVFTIPAYSNEEPPDSPRGLPSAEEFERHNPVKKKGDQERIVPDTGTPGKRRVIEGLRRTPCPEGTGRRWNVRLQKNMYEEPCYILRTNPLLHSHRSCGDILGPDREYGNAYSRIVKERINLLQRDIAQIQANTRISWGSCNHRTADDFPLCLLTVQQVESRRDQLLSLLSSLQLHIEQGIQQVFLQFPLCQEVEIPGR